jgi:large subunit ribosomal protein L31
MKTDIHPNYHEITTTCSCGNVLPVMSTLKDNISLDVCSKCHPFYTGKQKILDSGGRVKKFQDRFGASGSSKPAAKKTEAKKEEVAIEETSEEALETATEEVVEEASTEEASEDNAEADSDAEGSEEEEK